MKTNDPGPLPDGRTDKPLTPEQLAAAFPGLAALPDLLTVNETAKVFRCEKKFVYYRTGKKLISSIQVGRNVRIAKSEIMRILSQGGFRAA